MINYKNRVQQMKEELGEKNWKLYWDKLSKFRHLERKEQDKFIHQISKFSKLKSILLEMQANDEGVKAV